MTDTTNEDKGKQEPGGKTRKSAYKLPEHPEAESAETTEDAGGAEVIELGEARAVETGAGLLDGVIGDSLRQSFRKFVVDKLLPEGQKEGHVDMNIDVDFLRKHGTELISTLVEGVAKAILPDAVELNVPLAKGAAEKKARPATAEPASEAPAAEEAPEVDVKVNFDAMAFLKSLLAPVTASVQKPAEATADDTDDDELED